MNEARVVLSEAIPLAHPLTIHIEITNRCNFSCQYCPESLPDFQTRVGGFKFLSLDEFKTIARQIADVGKAAVLRLWIMGEPLLNKQLFSMIEFVKKSNYNIADRVEITTNASLLTSENISKLLDSGVDVCKISIYGFGTRFNEITQSKIPSDKIFSNVANLYRHRNLTRASTNIIVKMVDPRDSEELTEFKLRYGPISDHLEVFSPHSWAEEHSVKIYERNNSNKSIIKERLKLSQKDVCAFPFYTLSIHANGDVSVCCVDWEKKTLLGNVFTEQLIDIWRGQALKRIQNAHLKKNRTEINGCNACNYFYDNCPENLDADAEAILRRIAQNAEVD